MRAGGGQRFWAVGRHRAWDSTATKLNKNCEVWNATQTAQRPALLSSRWSSRRAASAAAPFGETLSGAYFTWWVMVGTSATLEAAGSRLPCNGWVRWEPSGLASASECRAVQSRQARPEEAQEPS